MLFPNKDTVFRFLYSDYVQSAFIAMMLIAALVFRLIEERWTIQSRNILINGLNLLQTLLSKQESLVTYHLSLFIIMIRVCCGITITYHATLLISEATGTTWQMSLLGLALFILIVAASLWLYYSRTSASEQLTDGEKVDSEKLMDNEKVGL